MYPYPSSYISRVGRLSCTLEHLPWKMHLPDEQSMSVMLRDYTYSSYLSKTDEGKPM